MNRLTLVITMLYITKTFSKKYISSSDESVDNLLYYKDCQHNREKESEPETDPTSTTTEITKLRSPSKVSGQQCQFPKMCCTMSCGDDCGSQSTIGRQMESFQQPFQPPRQPQMPEQPKLSHIGRKKGVKSQLQPPIGGRRDFGFTKDKIKNLISQDDDIRKILKDLVRVTMQKADLLELMNGRRSNTAVTPENQNNYDEDYIE